MPVTFTYQPGLVRRVAAVDDDQAVGDLRWVAATGVLIAMWVEPAHRGRGVATAMWEFANSAAVPEDERPRRPTEPERRTESGDALYWKARRRREAREAGETVPPIVP